MHLAPKTRARVRREFFPEDFHAAIDMLQTWDTRACAPREAVARMHTAVLNMSGGAVTELEGAIALAQIDYRDVLSAGVGRRPSDPGEAVPERPEVGFFETILANPADNTARLVYADWLEDRSDARADYLRVLCEWLTCKRAREAEVIARERELRAGLGSGWLARVRGMQVSTRTKRRRPGPR